MGRFVLLDPKAEPRIQRYEIAPRESDLSGKTVCLLNNSKSNADIFLSRVEERLRERFPSTTFVHWAKSYSSIPADFIEEMATRCQAVVNAYGD
jgi:hypothetical protein